MKYVYPAVFYNVLGGGYAVEFPDVEGAATQAGNLYDALVMAEDALAGIMVMYEDYKAGRDCPMNNRIVAPTPIEQVVAEPDEYSASAFVTLIKVDTDAYRETLAKMRAEKSTAEKTRAKVAA